MFLQFCVQLSTSFLQLFLKKQINFWIQNLCKIARGNIIREQLLFIFCIGIRKKISHTDFAYLFDFSNISGISSAPITNYSQRRTLNAHLFGFCSWAVEASWPGQTNLCGQPDFTFISSICSSKIIFHC